MKENEKWNVGVNRDLIKKKSIKIFRAIRPQFSYLSAPLIDEEGGKISRYFGHSRFFSHFFGRFSSLVSAYPESNRITSDVRTLFNYRRTAPEVESNLQARFDYPYRKLLSARPLRTNYSSTTTSRRFLFLVYVRGILAHRWTLCLYLHIVQSHFSFLFSFFLLSSQSPRLFYSFHQKWNIHTWIHGRASLVQLWK